MGKEKQPFRVIRTVFVDSWDIVADKIAKIFFHSVVLPLGEKIVARIDSQARERSVREILQAGFEGREPRLEAVEHLKYMPGSAVKDILTGNKRKEQT